MFFRPCAAGLSGLNEWTVPEFPVWTGLIQAPMQMGLVFGYGFGSGFCSGRFHSTRVITPGAQSVFPAVAGVHSRFRPFRLSPSFDPLLLVALPTCVWQRHQARACEFCLVSFSFECWF